METLLSFESIGFIVLFIIPGFISIKVWSFIVPQVNNSLSDKLVEVICYSCMNFGAMFWLINVILYESFNSEYLYWFLVAIVMFVAPILWPIFFYLISKTKVYKTHFINPIPRAWDFYFSRKVPCFILVHLSNGKKIGGLYHAKSFTSSYPSDEDIYIEVVWNLGENYNFVSIVEGSNGTWIPKEMIEYLEFFKTA